MYHGTLRSWFTYQGLLSNSKDKGKRKKVKGEKDGRDQRFLPFEFEWTSFNFFFLSFIFFFSPDAALRRLRNVRWLTGWTVGGLDYGALSRPGT